MYCNKCGKEVAEGTRFCENCGADVMPEIGNKGTRKIVRKIILLVLAVIVATSAVFGYTTLSNPMVRLGSAINKTFSAKNATFELVADYERIKGEIEIDKKDRTFGLHMKIDGEDDVWMRYDETEAKMYYKSRTGRTETEDIPTEGINAIEAMFDSLNGETDAESIKKFMKDNYMDDYINIDNLEKEGKKLAKKIAEKENLENVLGYEKTKENSQTVYNFNIDLVKLLAFVADNGKALFTSEGYSDIEDLIDDIEYEDAETMDLRFFVDGGYLVGMEGETDGYVLNVKISNINKTTIEYPAK